MPTALCAHCGRPSARRFCDGDCYHGWQRDRSATSLVARFWAKVNQTPTCWLWTAGTIRGYGQFSLPRVDGRKRTVYAHRHSYILTNGPIADHLSVLHRCDVPLCVNPDHLFLGTQADNLADARAKGRLVDGAHLKKLSDADLLRIQRQYRPHVNGRQLAARYGVTLPHLLRVVKGTARVKRPSASEVHQ